MNMCKGLEDWIAEEREAGRAEGRAEYESRIKELEARLEAQIRAQKEIEGLKAQIEAVRAETRELERRAEEAGIRLDEPEEAAKCGSPRTADWIH